MFLHSQRSKPRGIQYGGLLHRKAFPSLIAKLRNGGEPARRYAAGFLTHVVLDRRSHPYINYFAGWWDREQPETKRYRHMHPFLERLIDMELLDSREGRRPGELRFEELVSCGEQMPEPLFRAYLDALRGSASSAERDGELPARLHNAYRDAVGYYRYTSEVDDAYMREARRRESAGEISDRWLSLVYPPHLPYTVDVMNTARREWCHPCDKARKQRCSFSEIWETALPEAAELLQILFSTSSGAELETAIGPENLNDGLYGSLPCRRRFMSPLPLRELYDTIRRSYDP